MFRYREPSTVVYCIHVPSVISIKEKTQLSMTLEILISIGYLLYHHRFELRPQEDVLFQCVIKHAELIYQFNF